MSDQQWKERPRTWSKQYGACVVVQDAVNRFSWIVDKGGVPFTGEASSVAEAKSAADAAWSKAAELLEEDQ